MLVNYAAAAQGGGLGSFLPFILIIGLFAVMYFVMIRPQNKRRKEMQQMQRALEVGTYITTIGGLYGRVVSTSDDSVTIQISPEVTATFTRGAVAKSIAESDVPEAVVSAVEYVDDEDFEYEEEHDLEAATDEVVEADASENVTLSKDATVEDTTVAADTTEDTDAKPVVTAKKEDSTSKDNAGAAADGR